MIISRIIVENFRCFGEGKNRFDLSLKPGLTALVGENDAGKTAVIDALRYALGTTDQEWYRLEDADFRVGEKSNEFKEIKIICKFEELTSSDKRAFVEYLSYDEKGGAPALYLNWVAKDTGERRKGQAYRRVDVRSGKNGDGPSMVQDVRELLRATYLRPLRDAAQALSSGRGSRLAQVLYHTDKIKSGGTGYDPKTNIDPIALNVLGIGDLANALLEKQQGIVDTRNVIDANLKKMALLGSGLKSSIIVSGATASDEIRLRQLLEKLDLRIDGHGKPGLGSDNLLFMACEFLLLAQEDVGNKLLLIEEPEAHLHPQRQLRVIASLQEQAIRDHVQVIVTTHSPNLASAIKLDNLVIIREGRAFSMAQRETELVASDYRFLERFLDVTKANLFFARGVMIVEGDAENILLPTLANLLGCDFTENGVSVVNVGGVGLRRYGRIFQRKNLDRDGTLPIPVACVTDMDVMPNCAPVIVGKLKEGDDWPPPSPRRWRAKWDFPGQALLDYRTSKDAKASGQHVKTFISNEWTLEYDLALGSKDSQGVFSTGMAEDVYIANCLAEKDDAINDGKTSVLAVTTTALKEFAELKAKATEQNECTPEEVLASLVYRKLSNNSASKSVAAQYLAERLQEKQERGDLTPATLRAQLPKYLTEAIDYVTSRVGGSPATVA